MLEVEFAFVPVVVRHPMNALKGMNDLLSVKKGGKRKTRRNRRKGRKDL